MKEEFPHLIAGFDLIGDENKPNPLVDYTNNFLHFQKRAKALDLEIPFLFYAGETLGYGTEVDHNL
jgi:adenosine deaminase CECR1